MSESPEVCNLLRDQFQDEGKATEAYQKVREAVLKLYHKTLSQIDIEKNIEQLEPLIKSMVKLDDIQDDEQSHKEKLRQIMNDLRCPIE